MRSTARSAEADGGRLERARRHNPRASTHDLVGDRGTLHFVRSACRGCGACDAVAVRAGSTAQAPAGAAGRSSTPSAASRTRAQRWRGRASIGSPPATAPRPSASSAARACCERRPISPGYCRRSPAERNRPARVAIPIRSTGRRVDDRSAHPGIFRREQKPQTLASAPLCIMNRKARRQASRVKTRG